MHTPHFERTASDADLLEAFQVMGKVTAFAFSEGTGFTDEQRTLALGSYILLTSYLSGFKTNDKMTDRTTQIFAAGLQEGGLGEEKVGKMLAHFANQRTFDYFNRLKHLPRRGPRPPELHPTFHVIEPDRLIAESIKLNRIPGANQAA